MLSTKCAAVVIALVTLGVVHHVLFNVLAEVFWAETVTKLQNASQSCDSTQTNMIENALWPSCGDAGQSFDDRPEACGSPCYDKEFLIAMHDFTSGNANGLKVNYMSRPGLPDVPDANLSGWWLPAPDFHNPPRIVLQHGYAVNAQQFRVVTAQYLLRREGFGVLANNFRGCCDTDDGKVVMWPALALVSDLLGAWDYLVNDPEHKLGGAKPKDQVGIMGFSFGGYLAASALGLEREIPAAWLDGTVKSGLDGASTQVRHELEDMLGFVPPEWLLVQPILKAVVTGAARRGFNLNEKLPEELLPFGPDTERLIHLTANKKDEIVLWENTEYLVEQLKALPTKYNVTHYYYDDECVVGTDNHCADHLRDPVGYQGFLGDFWRKAFG